MSGRTQRGEVASVAPLVPSPREPSRPRVRAYTVEDIMSSNGVPIQDISATVGHKSTHVTETVYRHVIVHTTRGGATVMDSVFGPEDDESA
jgi:hypothetical protein